MALAIAYDEAKTNQIRRANAQEDLNRGLIGRSLVTKFFVARDIPDSPHATLAQWDPGRVSRAHFHVTDQFQVVVGGKGKLGRHDLSPYCLHFSRAYTPYGPLSAGTPLTFFVMRTHYDPGPHRLPQEKARLKQVPDRQPWQITRSVIFPEFQSGTAAANIMLQPVPGIKDENGLAAYTLSMKPNAQAYAPDPAHGDGQYLVVVKGSLLHDNKEQKAFALVFVEPKEGPFQIHAGPQGLEAIVLNFPKGKPRSLHMKAPSTAAGAKKWQCALCDFAYDEALGMPEDGILAGTRWEDVPDSWTCPDCSASKSDFQMVEV